jgi:UDP-4-amino-4-deoxy-L-arabinose-oxoglutarate aminotransferase
MKVDFYRHALTGADAEAVRAVLETPFLTSGGVGRAVEAQLCHYFGTRHAALVNSWTNGAAAALLALDIGPGDEVIVPAMTFIATANVAELLGAKPVFVDVDPQTLLMTPEGVAAAVTARTKAVIPVHLYGQMVDMKGLKAALSHRPDIAIIEDCAHCFEGQRDGERPGAHATCAIFSFYATKNIACGEGGALITNDEAFYQKFLQTRLHGMSAGAIDRFKAGGYRHWDMERLGMKANLPDLLACLLPPQIEAADANLAQRERVARRYEDALAQSPIRFQAGVPGGVNARHLVVAHVGAAARDPALSLMAERGVSCTVNYRSVPTLTYYAQKYGYTPESFPVSYAWGAGCLSLPFYPALPEDQQDYVIEILKNEIAPMAASAAL